MVQCVILNFIAIIWLNISICYELGHIIAPIAKPWYNPVMKKVLSAIFTLIIINTIAFAIEDNTDIVRIQCKGDEVKKTSKNEVAGTIFTFTLKDNNLYGREGELIKNAKITDEYIKGILNYKNGFLWEKTKFQINRYTGAFNYDTIYRTLDKSKEVINSGMCLKVDNSKKF